MLFSFFQKNKLCEARATLIVSSQMHLLTSEVQLLLVNRMKELIDLANVGASCLLDQHLP
jgi:hypothetical protein